MLSFSLHVFCACAPTVCMCATCVHVRHLCACFAALVASPSLCMSAPTGPSHTEVVLAACNASDPTQVRTRHLPAPSAAPAFVHSTAGALKSAEFGRGRRICTPCASQPPPSSSPSPRAQHPLICTKLSMHSNATRCFAGFDHGVLFVGQVFSQSPSTTAPHVSIATSTMSLQSTGYVTLCFERGRFVRLGVVFSCMHAPFKERRVSLLRHVGSDLVISSVTPCSYAAHSMLRMVRFDLRGCTTLSVNARTVGRWLQVPWVQRSVRIAHWWSRSHRRVLHGPNANHGVRRHQG